MIYVTYEEYQSAGGTLGEADFNKQARRASAYIDQGSRGRAEAAFASGLYADEIKNAALDLVDEMARQEAGGEVISATNDGYSETYATSRKSSDQKLYDILRLYLGQTELISRWV